jgi:hypothetical protein
MMMTHTAIRVSVLVLLGAMACSERDPSPASKNDEPSGPEALDETEIVKGVPSRGKDPAVVALRIGDQALCTGSLIAKDVVLTARHCVAQASQSVECPAQGRQVYRDHDPASIEVLVGDRAEGQEAVARGLEIVAPSGATLCDADIALVILDRPIANVKPLGVAVTGIAVGDTVRSVGFGRMGDSGPAGFKLVRESVRVLGVTPAEFTIGEATCQGDSGGPAIHEESGEVVGVVSRGGPSCQGSDVHNVYTRVDSYAWLIDMALARSGLYDKKSADAGPKGAPRANSDKPASDMGNACSEGAGCATGLCLVSGPAGYCTRRCGEGTRCPARFNCRKIENESVCVKVR